MEELLLNSYEAKIKRLPQSIRNILIASSTGDMIYSVCEKHGVGNRVFSYSGLIGLILMGELNPNFLVRNITEKEHIDIEKAKLIAMDLSEAVLKPVKKDLIILYGLAPKPQLAPQPETAPPKPVVPPPPPSTRQEGMALPSIPDSKFQIPNPVASSAPTPPAPVQPATNLPTPSSDGKIFYSPSPAQNPESVPPISSTPPNIIDLSKEPPRPVAKPGDPPLEGNIVNLKDINNNLTQ